MTLRRFPPIDLHVSNSGARTLERVLRKIVAGGAVFGPAFSAKDLIDLSNLLRIIEIKLATAPWRGRG